MESSGVSGSGTATNSGRDTRWIWRRIILQRRNLKHCGWRRPVQSLAGANSTRYKCAGRGRRSHPPHAYSERHFPCQSIRRHALPFGEPLVCTPRDAVRSFYSSGIDAMFVGHFLLQK
jgi:hypothetical protein